MNRLFRLFGTRPLGTSNISGRSYCSNRAPVSHPTRPYILGIETSCDETGAAVVDCHGRVLGEGLFSQQSYSSRFGGVIPALAESLHNEHVGPVVEEAMMSSGLRYEDLDAIAVTTRPGLIICLRAGGNYALKLCRTHKKPFMPIHHMQAHALTIRMRDAIDKDVAEPVEFPFLCLLVSGAHCILTWIQSVDEFIVLGQAIDGAPGEAYDKVSRRLKLRHLKPEYDLLSGGVLIEKIAREGNPLAIEFPNPRTGVGKKNNVDFSFAGIKSFAFNYIEEIEKEREVLSSGFLPNLPDFCASFQHAVSKHMGRRLERALNFLHHSQWQPPGRQRYLVVSGGVASNTYLKSCLSYVAAHFDYRLISPPPKLCTDNGIMIAWNAVERFKAGLGIIPEDHLPESIWFEARSPIGSSIDGDQIRSALAHSHLNKRIKIRELNFNDPSHLAKALEYSNARLKRAGGDPGAVRSVVPQ